MDFRFTPEQDEAAALAAQILADLATPERQRAVEESGRRFDTELWTALGDAGLLGLTTPESHDGAGLGVIELCRVLVEVGRHTAPVPLGVHGVSRLLISELGSPEQLDRHLRPGGPTAVVTAAVSEEREPTPAIPSTTARPEGDGFVLTGTKSAVPAATVAGLFLVPATTPSGVRVFLVEPGDPGVAVLPQVLSGGEVVGQLELADVPLGPERLLGDVLAASRLSELLTVAIAAEQLGVVRGAVRLTADYAKTREQFDRPIATFQAVSQRLADGYIDALCAELMLWQAAWRLDQGLPATVEVATAKLWAADAGHRVAHTTVHLHGGVGIDLDGTAHRYFTAAKRLEFACGGATEQALAIGRLLAAEPA